MPRIFALWLVLLGIICFLQTPALAKDGTPLNVLSAPVDFSRDEPAKTRFEKLQWIGTLRLGAESKHFGGFSALAIDGKGEEILALSDKGRWLRARILYQNGKPDGVDKAVMGKIRSLSGKPLKGKKDEDAESLAFKNPGKLDGKIYIGFERNHRIAEHKITGKGPGKARRLLKLPNKIRGAKRNSGLEALTVLLGGPRKGVLLAFTEHTRDKRGHHIGWLLGAKKPEKIYVTDKGEFAMTGLTSLGDDIFLLERRFRYSEGVKMRIRRLDARAIKPGAVLEGDVLLQVNQLFEIDNMEGIAAHKDVDGRTILTVISDDNFNRILQRTLLMQFALVE